MPEYKVRLKKAVTPNESHHCRETDDIDLFVRMMEKQERDRQKETAEDPMLYFNLVNRHSEQARQNDNAKRISRQVAQMLRHADSYVVVSGPNGSYLDAENVKLAVRKAAGSTEMLLYMKKEDRWEW